MSPGLKRAREPYLIKNALTGVVLGAFAVGIWAWSISAVKQDVFDDVDEEAKELMKAREKAGTGVGVGVGAGTTGVVTVGAAGLREGGVEVVVEALGPTSLAVSSVTFAAKKRGILQRVGGRFSGLLDPKTGSLVWGAPPVDHIGSLWDRSST